MSITIALPVNTAKPSLPLTISCYILLTSQNYFEFTTLGVLAHGYSFHAGHRMVFNHYATIIQRF